MVGGGELLAWPRRLQHRRSDEEHGVEQLDQADSQLKLRAGEAQHRLRRAYP